MLSWVSTMVIAFTFSWVSNCIHIHSSHVHIHIHRCICTMITHVVCNISQFKLVSFTVVSCIPFNSWSKPFNTWSKPFLGWSKHPGCLLQPRNGVHSLLVLRASITVSLASDTTIRWYSSPREALQTRNQSPTKGPKIAVSAAGTDNRFNSRVSMLCVGRGLASVRSHTDAQLTVTNRFSSVSSAAGDYRSTELTLGRRLSFWRAFCWAPVHRS